MDGLSIVEKNWGTPFNGPITLGDRSWQGQLNQLYFVGEKETDGSLDGILVVV